MFNNFKLAVLWALNRKQCPDLIPRSGSSAKKVDCYSVRFDSKSLKPYALVTDIRNKKIAIRLWNGRKFDNDYKCTLADLSGFTIKVIHYNSLHTIEYTGWASLILRGLSGYDRLKILGINLIKSVSQHYFNKTNDLSIQNIKLMNVLLDLHFNNKEINIYSVSDSIYTSKWFYHPNREKYRRKIDLHLDSLVEIGAINRDGMNYSVNGKLINLVTSYEREGDKHNDNITIQRRLVQITFVLVAVTAYGAWSQISN